MFADISSYYCQQICSHLSSAFQNVLFFRFISDDCNAVLAPYLTRNETILKTVADFSETALLLNIRALSSFCSLLRVFMATADIVSPRANVWSYDIQQHTCLMLTLKCLYGELLSGSKSSIRFKTSLTWSGRRIFKVWRPCSQYASNTFFTNALNL